MTRALMTPNRIALVGCGVLLGCLVLGSLSSLDQRQGSSPARPAIERAAVPADSTALAAGPQAGERRIAPVGARQPGDLPKRVRVWKGLTLAGRVHKAHAGPAQVQLVCGLELDSGRSQFPDEEVHVDARGAFAFRGLQPGNYAVTAVSDGYGSVREEISLTKSIQDVDLFLEPQLVLAGRIETDFPCAEGFPSTDLRPCMDLMPWPPLSGGGAFRYRGLTPGRYELQIDAKRPKERRSSVKRTFVFDLTESIEDLHIQLSQETHPVGIRTQLPLDDGFVDGTLTARSGHRFVEHQVRIVPSLGRRSHQIWTQSSKVFGGSASFVGAPEFRLDLEERQWEFRLELPGYEPWVTTLPIADKITLWADPIRLPGRIVNASLGRAPYLVEWRPHGKEAPWQDLLTGGSWIRPALELSSPVAFLPLGLCDLRVSQGDRAELLIQSLLIEPSPAPWLLKPVTPKGHWIQGKLTSNRRLHSPDFDLHLQVEESGQWRPLRTKRTQPRHLGPEQGAQFSFAGLNPGRYRASLDEAGVQVLDEWTLGEHSLQDQVLYVEFD